MLVLHPIWRNQLKLCARSQNSQNLSKFVQICRRTLALAVNLDSLTRTHTETLFLSFGEFSYCSRQLSIGIPLCLAHDTHTYTQIHNLIRHLAHRARSYRTHHYRHRCKFIRTTCHEFAKLFVQITLMLITNTTREYCKPNYFCAFTARQNETERETEIKRARMGKRVAAQTPAEIK